MESTPLAISTIADTWIHLSYVVHGGERNRALSIVKSRGTKHSNQVRELLLSDSGITLTDVYTAGGQVLMGTLRHQQEQAEQREQEQFRARLELKRRELEQTEATIHANIEVLQRDLEAKQQALRLLEMEQTLQEHGWMTSKQDLRRLRGADNSGALTPQG
jgi:circadian clock protein KaiC